MADTNTLQAKERTQTGKGGARKVRASGACPAILYGPKTEARALQVDPKPLQRLLSRGGGNALLDLEIIGKDDKPLETQKVIIRDIQYHPIETQPFHIDFYLVSLDKALTITVPLELTGVPEAVTIKTGSLSQSIYELHVECLPSNIPSKIEIDISSLEIGASLHVNEIQAPEGATILDNPDHPVATVTAMREEEVEEVEEEGVEAPSGEPEVIGQDKESAGESSGE